MIGIRKRAEREEEYDGPFELSCGRWLDPQPVELLGDDRFGLAQLSQSVAYVGFTRARWQRLAKVLPVYESDKAFQRRFGQLVEDSDVVLNRGRFICASESRR